MYTVEINTKLLNLEDLVHKYQNVEKFLPYCQSCENYEARWSCPPVNMNPKEFLQQYDKMLFIGFKVSYTKDFYKNLAGDKEMLMGYSDRLLRKIRKELAGELLKLEELAPGSRSFGAGSCLWCCKCSRPQNQPCKKPDKMRLSLDTFGLDLTRISAEEMQTPILWGLKEDSEYFLPDYYHLIFALGLKSEPSHELLQAINDVEIPVVTTDFLLRRHQKACACESK